MKRLLIAFLALFTLLTVFGLGIMTAPADATTPTGCKISVVSPLTQIGKSVSGKFSSNCPTTFSLAVYGAPGPKFDLATVDQQTFEGVEHIDLPGHGKPVTATATIPDCYFQAEAFIGDVIVKLSPSNLYGSRLLGPRSMEAPSLARRLLQPPRQPSHMPRRRQRRLRPRRRFLQPITTPASYRPPRQLPRLRSSSQLKSWHTPAFRS